MFKKYCHIKAFVVSENKIKEFADITLPIKKFIRKNYQDSLKTDSNEKIYFKKKFRLELRENATEEEIWGGFKKLMRKKGVEILEDN